MNIYQPAQGEIWYKDVNICDKKEFKKHKKMLQTRRQMIFQDSASSLNQKMKVSDIITEPMRIQHITPPRGSFVKEAAFQMEYVGLENSFLDRYPSELSGGQRQSITLLMATLVPPKLLLLDEHTAALDPKTAEKVLNLTQKRVSEGNLTTLMITHNMRDALRFGNRLIMMHEGRVVVDVKGEQKKELTIQSLLELFEKASGAEFDDPEALLTVD